MKKRKREEDEMKKTGGTRSLNNFQSSILPLAAMSPRLLHSGLGPTRPQLPKTAWFKLQVYTRAAGTYRSAFRLFESVNLISNAASARTSPSKFDATTQGSDAEAHLSSALASPMIHRFAVTHHLTPWAG